MITNYYILHQVVRELSEAVDSQPFTRAYSVRPGELQMVFGNNIAVTVILNPSTATLFLSSQHPPQSTKRNTISFFQELTDKAIEKIELDEFDKKIILWFDEYFLVLRFYDSPNALLYKQGELVSTFKKEPTYRKASIPVPRSKLQEILPMLGKQLEKQFDVKYPNLTNSEEGLLRSTVEFNVTLRTTHKPVLYEETLLLSPIRLSFLPEEPIGISPSEGIEYILRRRRGKKVFEEKKKILSQKLQVILGRTQKALADAEHGIEDSSRSERYKKIADGIQSIAYEIEKGSKETIIEIDEETEKVVLDPKLNAYENAAKYFEKARHSNEAKLILNKRIAELQKNQKSVLAFLEKLNEYTRLKELDAFESDLKHRSFLLEKSDEEAERSGDTLDRFRRFQVAGGFEVLAGKNAKQNDELTMKIATKEDLWFHARHVAGSHVVLRTAGKKEIPHQAILQAASIAAYFSDAKTQTVAPVAYTKRKFVRKRKGAALGEVVVDREEVVMVEPLREP